MDNGQNGHILTVTSNRLNTGHSQLLLHSVCQVRLSVAASEVCPYQFHRSFIKPRVLVYEQWSAVNLPEYRPYLKSLINMLRRNVGAMSFEYRLQR